MSREYSKDSPKETKYYWANGNIKKLEEYRNGALDKTDSIGTYSNLINKNYCGDFFNLGKRNRNWIESEDADKPTAAVHTYKSESDGFISEDLTTYSDPTNGKILRYYKIIYK